MKTSASVIATLACALLAPGLSAAFASEVSRQEIDASLGRGVVAARSTVTLAAPESRPRFCLAAAFALEGARDPASGRELELSPAGACAGGLRAWQVRAGAALETLELRWTLPVGELAAPRILGPEEGWYPRGSEGASIIVVRTEAREEGISLLSNAPVDASRALPLEGAYLLAGRWKSARLLSGSDALEFHYFAAGFSAPAFRALELLKTASGELGPLPGGRHLFVEAHTDARIDAPGLSVWPRELLDRDEDTDARLADALLAGWWGARVRPSAGSGDWTRGLRLYVATQSLLGLGGPGTRSDWIDEYALLSRGVSDERLARSGLPTRLEAVKGAMVFHALRRQSGERDFDAVLRALARRPAGPATGWAEVRSAFAQITRGESAWVFEALVERPGAPSLTLESADPQARPGDAQVTVKVRTETSVPLRIEVAVIGAEGDVSSGAGLAHGGVATLVVRPRSRPLFVEVDPQAHLLRRLADAELPPMLGLVGRGAPDLVLLGTGRDDASLAAARRFAATRGAARTLLDREARAADLEGAESVWIVGRPGAELRALLEERLPLARVRLAWLGDRAIGPSGASGEGGDAWILAALGRWPRAGGRVVLLDAARASGIVRASREALAEGLATWRVRLADGKLVEGKGPRALRPLSRRIGEDESQ